MVCSFGVREEWMRDNHFYVYGYQVRTGEHA